MVILAINVDFLCLDAYNANYVCFNWTNMDFILNGIGVHIVLNKCILLQADFEWNYRTRRDIAAVERNVLLKYAEFYLQRCQSERIQSKTFNSPTLISLVPRSHGPAKMG